MRRKLENKVKVFRVVEKKFVDVHIYLFFLMELLMVLSVERIRFIYLETILAKIRYIFSNRVVQVLEMTSRISLISNNIISLGYFRSLNSYEI